MAFFRTSYHLLGVLSTIYFVHYLKFQSFIQTRQALIMQILIELFTYIKLRKKYWLIPIFFFLFIFGGILVLAEGSVFAPFIYTFF
jgi:hypothetical protein